MTRPVPGARWPPPSASGGSFPPSASAGSSPPPASGRSLAHHADLSPDILHAVADGVGTPVYAYDARALDAGVRRWTRVVPPEGVWYAVKANGNLAVLRRLAGHGLGFEAATPGELARVRAAGVEPGRLMLGGVPKRPGVVAESLAAGLDLVMLQAEHEVEEAIGAAEAGRPAGVGVRVRPGIRAGSHPSLETGAAEAKFGLAPDAALEAWRRLSGVAGLEPRALSVHLGSGLDSPDPYERALDLLLRLAGEAGRSGAPVRELDLGGGLAVDYAEGRDLDPAALVARLADRLADRPGDAPRLRYEPGRSIVARMGILLTRLLYRRERDGAPALVCDAAFSDFARHVLYGAHHEIVAVGAEPEGEPTVDVLGATCESGDVIGRGRRLHGVAPGDLLAVRDAGAYGFAMASNYNGRPRPAEVLVEGGGWRVVRARESLPDLWRGEEPEGNGA